MSKKIEEDFFLFLDKAKAMTKELFGNDDPAFEPGEDHIRGFADRVFPIKDEDERAQVIEELAEAHEKGIELHGPNVSAKYVYWLYDGKYTDIFEQ